MKQTLAVAQIILSVILVIFILMQSQGSGLSGAFGGGGENYHTRRGVEKIVFYATIVATILFSIVSILTVAG